MENSKNQIDEYNQKLFAKLFPDKTDPIFCNSVLNPNDEIFNMIFKEIAKKHLDEILQAQEFDTEFEQIKHNLKIN